MDREMVKSLLVRLLPFAAMVTLECVETGLTTLDKAAFSKGMSPFVLILYSSALATFLMFSYCFFFGTKKPPLTCSLLCKFFLLSLAGITVVLNCGLIGLSYSSPTLTSAIFQLIPAFTFLLAVIFRLEKLDFRSLRSQIKAIGTLVSISGALVVILYKGPIIGGKIIPSHEPFTSLRATNSWVIGGLLLTISSFSQSVSNTFQAGILKEYPSEMSLASFYCLFGTIQCAVVSLIAEKNPNAWKLKPDIQLTCVICSAILGRVMTYSVIMWCIRKKGPVFVATFKPLGIAIAAFMSAIFLGDSLHVGSIIGAIIIVVGFYGVIWAQSQEEERSGVNTVKPSSPQTTPLLEDI